MKSNGIAQPYQLLMYAGVLAAHCGDVHSGLEKARARARVQASGSVLAEADRRRHLRVRALVYARGLAL